MVQVVLRFASSPAREATKVRSSSQSLGSGSLKGPQKTPRSPASPGILRDYVLYYILLRKNMQQKYYVTVCQSVRNRVRPGLDSGCRRGSCFMRSFQIFSLAITMPASHVKMHIVRLPEASAKLGIFFRMSPGCLGCKDKGTKQDKEHFSVPSGHGGGVGSHTGCFGSFTISKVCSLALHMRL